MYERYLVPTIFGPFAEDLIGLADPKSGERILDAACGTGTVARHAIERIGGKGKVVGLDLNSAMLAVARSVSNDKIEWREGDAAKMPFPDAAFDVVLCQQGLQFFPDKPASLREIHRVLVSNGRLGLSVWTMIDNSPGFALLSMGLAKYIGAEAEAFMHMPFSLGKEKELRSLVESAGFRNISSRQIVKTLHFASAGDFVGQYVAASPLAGYVGKVDSERQQTFFNYMNDSLQRFVGPGGLEFPIETNLLLASA
jgi:ubiquinone/menaquinone biosynthesis C-methylase UbiE